MTRSIIFIGRIPELVDRFRLFKTSRQAGHNAYNDILLIIKEFREVGLIIN